MTKKTIEEIVREDLDKPVHAWSDSDKQSWRDMGWRVPTCKCEECKCKRKS